MSTPRFCPEHGRDDVLHAWPCPVEGDSLDTLTCHHFAAEIDRRLREVTVDGNYFKTYVAPDGQRMKQQYRAHEPFGEPRPWGRRT